MTPRLSIVTACYNHAHFLAECIASVRSQTESSIEHIIVIDGATDDSLAVAHAQTSDDERATVWDNRTNRGLAASLNFGISIARAPWVMKVDADDRIAATYVEEILRAAEDDPRRNIIFSPAQHFGNRTDTYRYPPFDPRRMIDVLMIAGCAAIRRELWAAAGGYDETMRIAEDWDLQIRAHLIRGLVPHQLPAPLWFYRVHDGPRMSTLGKARVSDLRTYWRGHTPETVLTRSRSWGDWCEARGLAA